MNKHEVCSRCKTSREEGHFQLALRCMSCRGTGIVRVPASYHCNRCGDSLQPDEHTDDPYGLVEARVEGGYHSHHLFDLTSYTFSLCEGCLREMFDLFVIPPTLFGCSISGGDLRTVEGLEEAYDDDVRMYKHRLWKASGGQQEKFATGICNGVEACERQARWRLYLSDEAIDESVCDEHKKRYASTMNATFKPIKERLS